MAKKKKKIVQKPYQKGAAVDSNLIRRGLSVAGYTLISCLLYLLLGSSFVFENVFLRVLTNLMLVAASSAIIYYGGLNAGVSDVTYGEIIYRRQEMGGSPDVKDVARCYHPHKGFLCGVIGVSPFLIMCLILAFTAQLQTFTLGPLPDWVQGFAKRPEIGEALAYYQREISLGLTDYLRLIVRIIMMPYMNIVNTGNAAAALWLERLSPILMLIPAAAYGFGYRGGPLARAQIHTDIAAAKRKQKRREAKQAASRKADEPEQLI